MSLRTLLWSCRNTPETKHSPPKNCLNVQESERTDKENPSSIEQQDGGSCSDMYLTGRSAGEAT